MKRVLFVSRQFPSDIAKSVHGIYMRMRLFLDALMELSEALDVLFYVEPGVDSSAEAMRDGSKLTIYFRKPSLREEGVLPRGGIARFYGTAKIYKSGPVYDEVWRRLVPPEKERDPDKKGYAVLIAIERAEDLAGQPLNLD